jgi:hypothetical protein
MDRDRSNATAAARQNARPSNQLFVKHEGRKPLFSGATTTNTTSGAKDDGAASAKKPRAGLFNRRTNSESGTTPAVRRGSTSSVGSSGSTRIPRPSSAAASATSFLHRRPISLTEAYRLAEEEEKADGERPGNGSPSPAPRPWRAKAPSDEAKMRKMLSEDHLDSKRPSLPRPSTSPEQEPRNARNGASPSKREAGQDADTRQDERNATEDTVSRERLTDWKTRTRLSSGPLFPREVRDLSGEANLPALVPGIEDVPLPSIERATQSQEPFVSPAKSFAWELDQDFTAGDLTVSDSPRIRFGYQPGRVASNEEKGFAKSPSPLKGPTPSRNTKLDEIRAREVEAGINGTAPSPRIRQRNTKLDEIRTREQQAESQIPIPDRNQPRPKNTKLDEIRQREVNGLSKRTLAAVRLEEIRERNSMSRSLSPEEEVRPRTSREPLETGRNFELEPNPLIRPKSAFEIGGERIPDTPVTIYKGSRSEDNDKELNKDEAQKNEANPTKAEDKVVDSRDLLRRLARATSNSPAPEPEAQKPPEPPKADKPETAREGWRSRRARRLSDAKKANSLEPKETKEPKEPEVSRPTVEFAGLRRVRSTESTKSKRSSMHSEGDPVDRIDSEMKLFAPAENHSERGSVRAPSPKSDEDRDGDEREEDEPEATPRPKKQDFLSMPTPKVTGAYVETPATVRADDRFTKEREEVKPEETPKASSEAVSTIRERHKASSEDVATIREKPKVIHETITTIRDKPKASSEPVTTIRERKRTPARRTRLSDTASDPGSEDKDAAVTTSAAVRKPRARSLPRRRPILRNTAKPHSVKDDLIELQRAHNIDDSTLEDLEGLLFGRKKSSSPNLADLLNSPSESEVTDQHEPEIKTSPELEHHGDSNNIKKEPVEKEFSDGELAAYDRMSKSLRTGLLGIRTARQGIERLQDRVSHPHHEKTLDEKITTKGTADMAHIHKQHDCPACAVAVQPHSQHAWSYISIPVPRLYRRTPYFRITVFGLFTLLLSLWLAAESSMCALYCRPTTCSPSDPCVYTLDDPTFGVALPVKLDQWTTGGRARAAVGVFLEEAQSRVADILDEALGRDPTHPDYARGMSFAQRRRLRRRLRAKGLVAPRAEPNKEEKAKWEAWERVRKADERVREAREMGYVLDDEGDGTIGGDERVG